MSIRGWIWGLGLLGVAILAGTLPRGEPARGFGPLLLLLAGFLVGLTAEVAALIRSLRASPPRVPEGARPADGQVEIIPVAGTRSDANARDPRFRRFLALEPAADVSEPPRAGGVPRLLGRVAILSLFIGRDGRGWSDAEIARAHAALWRAGAWIEGQAMRWGAAVNVALVDTYFAAEDETSEEVEVTFVPEGDREAPFEADATGKALAGFSRAAARLGFADAADLITRIDLRVAADSWVWLLHPRRAGRSLAVPDTDTTWPGVTLAVCYAREASFPEPLTGPPFPDPVTFVHELLHLFGATDKYGVSLRSFPARSVTDRDVMCLNHEALSRLRIDPLTASEIGWTPARRA